MLYGLPTRLTQNPDRRMKMKNNPMVKNFDCVMFISTSCKVTVTSEVTAT
jgi:hypothetical protein